MTNAKQITVIQAYQKAVRLGYVCVLSDDYATFFDGDQKLGRAKIRNGCVDAISVSLLIGSG